MDETGADLTGGCDLLFQAMPVPGDPRRILKGVANRGGIAAVHSHQDEVTEPRRSTTAARS